MPHPTGFCKCGRKKHYPKNAPVGFQWKCRKCGRVYNIVKLGTGIPLKKESSKRPRNTKKIKNTPVKKVVKNQSQSSCLLIFLAFIISILSLSLI